MGAEITSPNEARTTINSDIRAKSAWHVLAFFLQRFGTGKGGMRIMRKMFELEKPCKDHLGNQYPSITEMCKAYKIKPETYNRRIKVYMWSVEKALTTPVKKNGGQYCYDHEGTRFKSESLMCKHWGIERKTYAYRRKKGLSVEEALTNKPKPGTPYSKAEE